MTNPTTRAAHSLQWVPADLERVDAAAKAVNESRSLFVRKAALARAAEVEAGRERRRGD